MNDADEQGPLLEIREGSTDASGAGPSRPTTKSRTKRPSKKAAEPTPGIVYISRLPPGMTPQKVRHLMARWGEVGKVYAQRRDTPTGYDPNHAANEKKRKKHAAANYSEAWVEFMDKSVAKTVARMLNAEIIGGKKGDRWRDDIWTMKYLSGFKWEMLGAQVAYEKQAHQSRLSAEVSRSRTEQADYLKNVEFARVLEKRKRKRDDKEAQDVPGRPSSMGNTQQQEKGLKRSRNANDTGGREGREYTQREAVSKAKGSQGLGIDSVLRSVFA